MITLEPLPDELAAAHEGRLAMANALPNQWNLHNALNAHFKKQGIDAHDVPDLHRLAMAAGMDASHYAVRHTLMPAIRVVCRDGEDRVHGHSKDRGEVKANRRGGLTKSTQLCPLCVEDDLRQFHFSWFRRTHQLTGFDWCPVHGVPLHQVVSPLPFSQLPHHWLERGETHPTETFAPTLPSEDAIVGRYVRIYLALLARDRPIPASKLNPLINARAKSLGLVANGKTRTRRLSDLVNETVPRDWLLRHIPNWHKKQSRIFYPRLDYIVRSYTTVCPGDAYALALAALWSSVADALAVIAAAAATPSLASAQNPVAFPAPLVD
jgi:hypothetical protein